MTKLKRLPIKYIRDFIKKDYKTRDYCYICGSTEYLELHHIYSVSELFNAWLAEQSIHTIDTEEQIFEYRVRFSKDCYEKLSSDNLYTLCSTHHKRLHNIYGQRYGNHLAPKIINWLKIQKEKHGN